MNLGSVIVQLRTKKGLKQQELARKLNVTQTYISQLENNRKKPSIPLLENLSQELDTPLPFIFFLALEDNDIPESMLVLYQDMAPYFKRFIDAIIN